MKKKYLLLLFFVLLSSQVMAIDIAYVVKSYTDTNLISAINETGYRYSLVYSQDVAVTNFSQYKMILVGDEKITGLPVNSYKSLAVGNDYYSGWSDYVGSKSSDQPLEAYVLANDSITKRGKGWFKVYTSGNSLPVYFLSGGSYPVTGSVSAGNSTWNSGESIYDYIIATKNSPRRVFFGITETNYWTPESKQMFKNSLIWVMKGDDKDGDGYYTDNDCNDNNANVWQNIPGYLDSDRDGFGTGSLLQICSGNSLLSGYSAINGDCNDGNYSVNPNAVEVAYDNVDNDCKNGDLADVDNDGYCKRGYWIQNSFLQCVKETGSLGTDCNDSVSIEWKSMTGYIDSDLDSYGTGALMNLCTNGSLGVGYSNVSGDCNDQEKLINPGATEVIDNIDQNCVNDAPFFIGAIQNFTWNEDAVLANAVNLNDYFKDYEGDNLIFGIYNTTLDKNITVYISINGNVSLSSTKDWFGEDWVIFNATDTSGSSGIGNKVYLKVNSVNDAPKIISANNVTVEENQEAKITVNASDVDSDSLDYYVDDTTNKTNFIQDSVNKNLFTWKTTYNDAGTYYVKVIVSDGTLTAYQTVKVVVNNFNRAPVMQEIGEITILEDSNYTVKLNASDSDNDSLVFSIKAQNTIQVRCFISGTNLNLVPVKDWNGNSSCLIEVSDSALTDSKTVLIEVLPVNDAPKIISANNVSVEETQEAKIIINASDVDSDSLNYYVDDTTNKTNFIQDSVNNNTFTWKTTYNDAGTYYVKVSASDGILNASQSVKVVVNNFNRAPVMQEIESKTIDEDTRTSFLIYASDEDGDSLSYKIKEKDTSKVNCEANGNNVTITPAPNFYGDASCVIEVSDGKLYDAKKVNIKVLNVNDAPVIDSYLPSFNPIISKRASQNFSIVWHDADNANSEVSVNWYLDNNPVGTGNSYKYDNHISGNLVVKVVVSDLNSSVEKSWNLSVVEKPQTTKYNGDTTDFSSLNDSEIENVKLTLEKTGIGRIDFLEPADLRYAVDFDHYSDIQTGLAAMDTNYLSVLAGKIAKITLYGLGFDKMPVIYYDSGFKTDRTQINSICPDNVCQNAIYNNGTLSFTSHFSSFRIGDTLTCSQQLGSVCSASEICTGNWLTAVEDRCCSSSCAFNFSRIMCSNVSSNVQVEIKEPDEGDDFNVGDTVNVKVRVYNELEKSQSFNVEAYLYDLTDNVKVDSYDKDVRVKKDDREDVEFTIDLDSDLDEGHSYAIFVRAEDDYCNQDYVKINIERNEHDVKITNFNLPEVVNCGEEFEASVSIENVGDNDEDVSLEMFNSELRINERTSFELESSGGSDKKTKVFSLFVPDYSEEKNYSIRARVEFSDETTSLEREIFVNCAKQKTEIVKDTNVISFNGNQIKSMNKQSLTDKINSLSASEMVIIIADMFILLGIIFIILFLIIRK